MINYPHFDPVAISLGSVKVHWYGIMYLIGAAAAWWLGRKRARTKGSKWTDEQVSDLIFWGLIGVILGGRFGYTLFYNLPEYLAAPMRIFKIWEGGMSFHGGLIGVLVAMWLYARKHNRKFFEVTDFLAPLVPIGLGAGRIGNFINGELWGKPSDVPWAMVLEPGGPAYHPSMLYEALLEGLVLFCILWIYSSKPRPTMVISGLFLVCYGVFRFLVEFVRTPDAQLGYLAFDWVTMGQVLSTPMIVAGGVMIYLGFRLSGAITADETNNPKAAKSAAKNH